METKNKNILLAIVLLIIIGVICYIEAHKPAVTASQSVAEVSILDGHSSSTVMSLSSTTASLAQTTFSASTTSAIDAFDLAHTAELKQKANEYSPAVEIVPGGDPSATSTTPFGTPASSGFINTGPFALKSLIGQKVVLIDFWTYSCINCLRTLPYLEAWYAKYKNYGLEIVGIHTPEFDFEKNYANVSAAVKRLGITYPVVQDNNNGTWNAYDNEYWPNEFLVDIDGYIVHNQIGEGDYDKTEEAIQNALKERVEVLGGQRGESQASIEAQIAAIPAGLVNPSTVVNMDASHIASPETYFGSARNEYLANGIHGVNGKQTLVLPSGAVAGASFDPSVVSPNALYLGGDWDFEDQYARSASVLSAGVSSFNTSSSGTLSSEKIIYRYNAKNVYFVASSQGSMPVMVKVLLDGKPISPEVYGADVSPQGTVTIQADRLYSLVNGADYGAHTLELDIEGPSLDAYTFTFG